MLPIPQTFKKDGHRYHLLKRVGDWCLWRLRVNGSSKLTSYEVSRLVKCRARTFPNGITTPAHEALPSDAQIGRVHGWAPSDLGEAERLFKEAVEAQAADKA